MMRKRRRLHARYGKRRNPESTGGGSKKSNPPLMADLAEFIVPGFAGFAATRFLTRVAATHIARKKPAWAKHAGAIASVGSFLAAWWGAHRVKMLEKHHTPIVVGSAIAAIQSIIQLYIPKLGWMIADASPQLADEAAGGSLAMPMARASALPAGLELTDEDPASYTYNDMYDAGRYSKPAQPPGTAAEQRVSDEESLISDITMDDQAGLGIFGSA